MCRFLYGGINEDVNINDLKTIKSKAYNFKPGSIKSIKKDLNAHLYNFTITKRHCDCDTFIGKGDANHPEVKRLAEHITGLQSVRGIKWISIAKKWWDDNIEEIQTVHMDDINLTDFLADLKEKCLYKIQLFT